MKFLILSENSNGTWPYLHFRGLGALELHKRVTAHGYQSTVIDWFTHWSEDQLKQAMLAWFTTDQPVLALSTPFDARDVYRISSLLSWAKTHWPNLKVIHGGARTFNHVEGVDVYFLGRSMQVFDSWIKGSDLSAYTVNTKPLVLKNSDFNQTVDTPVLPKLSDEDFYTPRDILGFEVGVGCKFNCTFCNYELRGAKVTTLLDSRSLHDYFLEAYQRWGITNFFAADDTPNETDEKLSVIADAVEGLPFKPTISAYSRLDIITARPSQLELYRRIQFGSLFFGIESFNDTASRLIRKKSYIGSVNDTLKALKTVSPNTFTVGGVIIGLNGDSEQHIRQSFDTVVKDQLLDSLQIYPLNIARSKSIQDDGYQSQLDLDPEKFGYKINSIAGNFRTSSVQTLHWSSDWSDFAQANQLSEQLSQDYSPKINFINHMEYAGLQALGIGRRNLYTVPKQAWTSQAYAVSNRLKQNYIKDKLNWFLTN